MKTKAQLILLWLTIVFIGVCAEINARGSTLPIEKFVDIIELVESGNDYSAIGDNGQAFGGLQIHPIMVRDFNRIYGTKYIHTDAFERPIARKICRGILEHYAKDIPNFNAQHAAYIWKEGGDAWELVKHPEIDRAKSLKCMVYWHKVKQLLSP